MKSCLVCGAVAKKHYATENGWIWLCNTHIEMFELAASLLIGIRAAGVLVLAGATSKVNT